MSAHSKEIYVIGLLALRRTAFFSLFALTTCAQVPPDYSPHYSSVPVYNPARPDRIARYVTVPDSCLTPDPTSDAWVIGGPILPPGCANTYNLLRMTEKERDLYHGRKLGAAPAAPTVRAAQRYLNGNEGAHAGAAPQHPTDSTIPPARQILPPSGG
jgi:hypothetical protein